MQLSGITLIAPAQLLSLVGVIALILSTLGLTALSQQIARHQ